MIAPSIVNVNEIELDAINLPRLPPLQPVIRIELVVP
jgi:hypothetical protein